MDSAAKQMLETVDARIAKLQTIKQLILEEFSTPHGASIGAAAIIQTTPPGANGSSKKTQIHEWLKTNGPSPRKDIIAALGFAGGTVGALLSQHNDLFENRDGKWTAR